MPGFRIVHPTARNKTVIIPHPGGGVINPKPKDYHIRVDTEGFTIVSPTVWEGMKECEGFGFTHGFTFANEVDNPPAQGVGFNAPTAPPEFERVGQTREGSPSFIEKMKREGIIPKGVKPTVTRHKIVPKDEDN